MECVTNHAIVLIATPLCCPPEMWDGAIIGKYYRPMKTQISFRVDNDVLDWLKSKGEGHLTRINTILRERMEAERRRPS
jgi:uncharacterized protein (DUF4415 family)